MKKYFFDFTRSLAFLWLRYIRTSDWCAPRFQTTTRLHGNAQRPEINKAINNIRDSLVQNKIEVEGALAGPLLLLLLLLSLQLSSDRDIETENSNYSQDEEHASPCPRHLSRLLLTTPALQQLKSFTSPYHPFPDGLCAHTQPRFLVTFSFTLFWVHSVWKNLVKTEPASPSLLFRLREEGGKKKRSTKAGQDEGEERHPRRHTKLHFIFLKNCYGGRVAVYILVFGIFSLALSVCQK